MYFKMVFIKIYILLVVYYDVILYHPLKQFVIYNYLQLYCKVLYHVIYNQYLYHQVCNRLRVVIRSIVMWGIDYYLYFASNELQ